MSERPTAPQVRGERVTSTRWASGLPPLPPQRAAPVGGRQAVGYVRALISDTERKNGWQLAEALGEATPDGVQHLLARADWDADAVRDDPAGYVAEYLGEAGGVADRGRAGLLKKGTWSCRVARQYTDAAGRIENAQVGVLPASATPKGHARIDRALYLPRGWADGRGRCEAAGVPDGVGFATKPQLAERMIRRARRLGVRAAWVTGDAVSGRDGRFRRFLEESGHPMPVMSTYTTPCSQAWLKAGAAPPRTPRPAAGSARTGATSTPAAAG